MKLADFGDLDAPVLVFGGPYSNLQATRALADLARLKGIPPGRMICTGDTVAYCAQPAETVAFLRALGCPVVAGNCERQLAAYEMTCGCGFEAGTACDILSAGWFAHADGAIGARDRAWMAALPDVITFRHSGRRVAVIHGGVTDISRFLWSCSPHAEFATEIAALRRRLPDLSLVVAGHSGIPFHARIDGVDWVNAGVIGLPPHDGGPETRCALLDGGGITIRSLAYDWEGAERAMISAGLTQGYHTALRSGRWPSEDVLPPQLRVASRASG